MNKKMKFQKKTSVAGQYAKKGEDINDGDKIIIKDGGTVIQGQFGEQNVFKIETKNGERLLSINQTSINSLIDEWGEESANWEGKQVNVISIKQNVSGKFINVYYVAPDGYEMGETGFVKNSRPTVGGDDVHIEDISF